MPGPASMPMTDDFSKYLAGWRDWLRFCWDHAESTYNIKTRYGTLSLIRVEDDGYGEDYFTLSFMLPDGVYAEIEDGTYGQLQGFRIYREDD